MRGVRHLRIKMKFAIILSLSLLAAPVVAKNGAIEKACLADSCFEKAANSKQEENAKAAYMELVELIDSDPMKVFHIAEDFVGKSENPGRSVKKYFGWISGQSLTYVIVGRDYCAVLLTKTGTDRYALFFNNEIKKFEISYKIPQEFEAIDKLWINGSAHLRVNQ